LVQHIVSHGMQDHVAICSGRLSKAIEELNPRLKITTGARSAEFAQKLVDELHPRVPAFDAADFKPDIIAVARAAKAKIYVDKTAELVIFLRGAALNQHKKQYEFVQSHRDDGYWYQRCTR
jgi:hypothetical protein